MNHFKMDTEKARKISRKGVKKNYLAKGNRGIKYLRYRMLRPLLKVRTKFHRMKFKPAPWTTPASIMIFDELLNENMTAFEYGSGSSTLFFAKRVGKLISVDHHPGWYTKISGLLRKLEIRNVDYYLIEQNDNVEEEDFDKIKAKLLSKITDLRIKWWYSQYFEFINKYDDDFFDFILIDGRARVECLVNAMDKLKSGGMLALDNSERLRYHPVFDLLHDWEMIDTTNGLTNTTIWFKP